MGLTAGPGNQAAEHADGGGFPGSVGPEQAEYLTPGHVKGQAIDRGDLPELLPQVLDFDHIHNDLLLPPVSQPGPNHDPNEDDGHHDPENKIGGWEGTCFCADLDECDNARNDDNDGQC